MNKFLSGFITLCLIVALASPACTFIAGKNLMEICFSDGSVQQAEIPEELLAYLPTNPQQDDNQTHSNKDCAFCFSLGKLDHLKPAPIELLKRELDTQAHALYVTSKLRLTTALYDARGPPTLV